MTYSYEIKMDLCYSREKTKLISKWKQIETNWVVIQTKNNDMSWGLSSHTTDQGFFCLTISEEQSSKIVEENDKYSW